jgi:hypothetical protein
MFEGVHGVDDTLRNEAESRSYQRKTFGSPPSDYGADGQHEWDLADASSVPVVQVLGNLPGTEATTSELSPRCDAHRSVGHERTSVICPWCIGHNSVEYLQRLAVKIVFWSIGR